MQPETRRQQVWTLAGLVAFTIVFNALAWSAFTQDYTTGRINVISGPGGHVIRTVTATSQPAEFAHEAYGGPMFGFGLGLFTLAYGVRLVVFSLRRSSGAG